MLKKEIVMMLICLTLFSLSSCGFDYRYALDSNKNNQVECVWEENDSSDPSYIIYKNKKYFLLKEEHVISINKSITDVQVSWNGYRYLGYVHEFHSYTEEDPVFIYSKYYKFIREDYNYLSDTFLIENTSIAINGDNLFDLTKENIDFTPQFSVNLYSEQCPRIKVTLNMSMIEDQWYVSIPNTQAVWTASDELVRILSENQLIQK